MISEYLEVIHSYLPNSNNLIKMPIGEIENKIKHLEIKLSKPFIEFYEYFGNNEQVFKAYYEFEKVEDFKVYNDAIIFCYGHQKESLIGVLLNDIEKEDPSIKKTFSSYEKWYSECTLFSNFFVNLAESGMDLSWL